MADRSRVRGAADSGRVPAGDDDHALHVDHPEAPSLLQQYLDANPQEPKLGGAPRQTIPGNAEGKAH
jgi:hypothetical protein